MRYRFLLFVPVLAIACNVDYKSHSCVSESISESKTRNVFLAQYNIDSISDSASLFEVKEVWIEKNWNRQLDSTGKEIDHININSAPRIVVALNDSFQLTKKNCYQDWIAIDNKSHFIGTMEGGVCFSLLSNDIPDSLQINIFRLKKPWGATSDTLRIGKIWLHK